MRCAKVGPAILLRSLLNARRHCGTRQYGKINLKFAHGIKKALFGAAQTAGNERYRMGKVGSGCFYNLLPMKLVQKAIGGNVKFMATGSAPLLSSLLHKLVVRRLE